MAKSKKPAIAGIGRPAGFLDDIVYPIVQKVARKSIASGAKRGVVRKKSNVAYDKMVKKRLDSYDKIAVKELNKKGVTKKMAVADAKADAMRNPTYFADPNKRFNSPRNRARQVRRETKSFKSYNSPKAKDYREALTADKKLRSGSGPYKTMFSDEAKINKVKGQMKRGKY